MAYTHTTRAQLRAILRERLDDPSTRYWTDAELNLYLNEALRTFGVMSAFWRDRGTVTLQATKAFYDLQSEVSGSLLSQTITDQDLILDLQYALLEATTDQTSWPGTSQFVYNDVVNAIRERRNQFLADAGIILTKGQLASTLSQDETLSDDVVDVRRMAWIDSTPGYYSPVFREDEGSMTFAEPDFGAATGIPTVYSILGVPPVKIRFNTTPTSAGVIDLLTVNTGPDLAPAVSATVLGIPDDMTPAIKWGALADLLGKSGSAADPQRAAFCEQRYRQYVALARMLPAVVYIQFGGLGQMPSTLWDLDTAVYAWQNNRDTPAEFAMAGWNMLVTWPVPDASGSVSIDVVQKAPVPTADGDNVQIGREQIDMIVDYSEHLAMFKSGGAEFEATILQADEFLLQAITYNQRLSAAARYVIRAKDQSQREKFERQRRQNADGLGALPSQTEAQSVVKQNSPVRLNTP